ncbi:MAG: TPR end-of-group domain-containing protein [Polyangia bacterium]
MRALVVVAVVLGAATTAAAASEPTDPVGRYNLACKYALANDRDHAFQWLDKAIEVGFGSVETMEKDPDLASLRGDARWAGAVGRARAKANPCKSLPEARQLDFWLGDWDVHDPKGHLVGHSSIQLLLNDCVVYENWTGTLGGSGKSFNFWDKDNHRWQQTWVDDRGGVLQYTGHLVDGSMKYATSDGKRLTFAPLSGGRVRQLSELSKDGGKTWAVEYDFTYSRHK